MQNQIKPKLRNKLQDKIRLFAKGLLNKESLRKIRPLYHIPRAWLAAAYYGFPGKKLKLIGVTGTKGKTTTTVFLGRLLNLNGQKTGFISSALINSGDFKVEDFESGFSSSGESLNQFKMSTIDAWEMQKLLKGMYENGCKYVVLEMTSQGLEAGRHIGLGGFDISVFLNIFPEHIDAHGGFENYKKAKAILVENIRLNGVFITDVDSSAVDFMLQTIEDRGDIKRVLIDFKNTNRTPKDLPEYKFNELEKFELGQSVEGYQVLNYLGKSVETNFFAKFDALNLGFAWVAMLQLGLKPDILKLSQIWGVPGRMEWVLRNGHSIFKPVQKIPSKTTTQTNFYAGLSVMVDYAHETESLRQLLETLSRLRKNGDIDKIIHIFSVTGSGRDVWKRPQMARVTAEVSDAVIYTTEDHDEHDDLNKLQVEMLENLRQSRAKRVESNLDRKEAFKLALEISQTDFKNQKVLIVSTAMGSQQGMETAKGLIEWDERQVWAEVLGFL